MADWILVPCLVRLRSEFNAIAPGRDKSSDGSIGDTAHQATQSDHNDDEVGNVPIHDADKIHEVHAIDVDVDLRESDLTMEKVVQFLLGRCRSGAEKRLRYIIYNRRIWEQSNGWRQKAYNGSNPHDHHAHFSASYTTSLEASTASWHLEDIPVALTSADKTWITAAIDRRADQVEANILAKVAATVGNLKVDVNPGGKANPQPWSRVDAYGSLERKQIREEIADLRKLIESMLAPTS
ncbi:hypothetical protein AB0J83_10510 [Actinoplanes sp. NPDC049596]|uniref:hypothetical protein n=1 Tax=unclassified Actinoplanes TaxID=2626549 RepID=UPI00342ACC04